MQNYEALNALCVKRLGATLDQLSEIPAEDALPAILAAVAAERVEIQKSASLVVRTISEHCPTPSIVRDEAVSPEPVSSTSTIDNSIFDSLLPI